MASPLFFCKHFFLWNWTTNQLVVPACFFFQIRYTQGRGKRRQSLSDHYRWETCVLSRLCLESPAGVSRPSTLFFSVEYSTKSQVEEERKWLKSHRVTTRQRTSIRRMDTTRTRCRNSCGSSAGRNFTAGTGNRPVCRPGKYVSSLPPASRKYSSRSLFITSPRAVVHPLQECVCVWCRQPDCVPRTSIRRQHEKKRF